MDDNLGFLEAVRQMLQDQFTVVGTLSAGASVIDAVADLHPDVVVLDISLGETTGFEVARQLRSIGATAKIVFLTMHEGLEFVRAARRLGASGYVYKSQTWNDLPKAVAAANRGKTYFPGTSGDEASNHH